MGGGGDEGMSHGRVSPCLETREPRTEEVAMKIFVAGPARALGRRLVPICKKDDEGNPAEWPGG